MLNQLSKSNGESAAALLLGPTANLEPGGIICPLEMTSDYVYDLGPDLF